MDVVTGPDSSREEMLTQWVAQYQRPLLTLCYTYLHDRQLAEDAVQETFLRAYRAMETFRGESTAKTWLTKIAVNICRDTRKRAWFSHENRRVTPEDVPTAVEGFRQEAADLAAAIKRLPDKYKEVILLYYYQEMTMPEIAAALEVTSSTVSRRIQKAQAKLQGLLGKEYLHG